MVQMGHTLELDSCPHCGRANPALQAAYPPRTTQPANGQMHTIWSVYVCISCGNLITARAAGGIPEGHVQSALQSFGRAGHHADAIFPTPRAVEEALPDRARAYLKQALDSRHAPDGAVMLAAAAVDAMLKAKGYTKGNLYGRIEKAAEDRLITAEMAQWAHQVRLDANEPRHADEANPHHDGESALRAVDFAEALGEFLFVLPGRVTRGLSKTAAAQEG